MYKCQHRWIYDKQISMSNPQTQKRICSECLDLEDFEFSYPQLITFDELVKKRNKLLSWDKRKPKNP